MAAVSFPLAPCCFRVRAARDQRCPTENPGGARDRRALCKPFPPTRWQRAIWAPLGSGKGTRCSDSPRSGELGHRDACVPSAWQFFCHDERGLVGFILKLQFHSSVMCTFFCTDLRGFKFDSPWGPSLETMYLWECLRQGRDEHFCLFLIPRLHCPHCASSRSWRFFLRCKFQFFFFYWGCSLLFFFLPFICWMENQELTRAWST